MLIFIFIRITLYQKMEGKYAQHKCVSCYNVNVQKKPSKMQKQKFLHKSAFLGMSSSFDGVSIGNVGYNLL